LIHFYKRMSISVGITLVISVLVLTVNCKDDEDRVRAQVKYLGGITFLLDDRCPPSARAEDVSKYNLCVSAEPLHTICTTDNLRNGDKLTVPVYTDICSARCYRKGNTRGLHDCPVNGKRLDGRGRPGNNEVDAAIVDRFIG